MSIDSSDDSEVLTSEDEEERLPNTALLSGPNGVGKTASVYALAHEMGFKVLEVNASTTRSGRQVLANLREATQSHDVRSKQALILFEDIDLIFEEADEGFYAAVNSLIASTRRPILLTTSSLNFLAMQNSTGKGRVLKLLPEAFHFSPVEPDVAARHLQLIALVEGFAVGLGRLIALCRLQNVGQALLTLQCWTMTASLEFAPAPAHSG